MFPKRLEAGAGGLASSESLRVTLTSLRLTLLVSLYAPLLLRFAPCPNFQPDKVIAKSNDPRLSLEELFLKNFCKIGNEMKSAKPGLYANIHAKRKRIAAGSGEAMRKVGSAGAPTAKAFRQSAKTAKKK